MKFSITNQQEKILFTFAKINKMKRLFTILFLFSSILVQAQKSTISVLGNSYPAVSFVFTSYVSYGDYRLFPDKDINISIAKKGAEGLIQIAIDLPADKDLCDYFHKCGISGDIALQLANGDTIVCKDKGITDFLNGRATATYSLSSNDMELLRKENIEIIQFYLQTFNTKGNYIAANFHHTSSNTPDEFTRKKERVSITKVHKLVRQLK